MSKANPQRPAGTDHMVGFFELPDHHVFQPEDSLRRELSMRLLVVFTSIAAIALSGCKAYSPEQVSRTPDKNLCQVYWDGALDRQLKFNEKTNALINAEVAKRKLDCHPDNQSCLSFGLKHGTKEYAECRMKLRQMAEERQQLDDFMQGLKEVKGTPSSSEVIIRNNPNPFIDSIR